MDNNTNIQVEDKINPIPLGSYTINRMFNDTVINSEQAYINLWNKLDEIYYNIGATDNAEIDRSFQKEINGKYFKNTEQDVFKKRFLNLFKEIAPDEPKKNINANSLADKANEVLPQDNNESEDSVYKDLILKKVNRKTIGEWFKGDKPKSQIARFAFYKLSFAFELSWKKHVDLFTKICKVKLFLRTPAELCLTYCKQNNMTYADAVSMYEEYLKRLTDEDYMIKLFEKTQAFHESQVSNTEPLNTYKGTKTIFKEICQPAEIDYVDKLLIINDSLRNTGETIINKIKDTTKIDEINSQNLSDFLTNEDKCKYHYDEFSKQSVFYFNPEEILKIRKKTHDNIDGGYTNILNLRKVYIICLLWDNFIRNKYNESDPDNQKTYFTEFIKNANINLINMNLPQLDPLDDFDTTMILCAAYLTISNWTDDFTLDGLIKEIYFGKTETM